MNEITISILETYFVIHTGSLDDKGKTLIFDELHYRYDNDIIEMYKNYIHVRSRITHGLLHDLLTDFDVVLI